MKKKLLTFLCLMATVVLAACGFKKVDAGNYLNGIYQYVKYGYVLQFDGKQTKAVYALDDLLMKHNLKGKVKQQTQMEREVKAIIQQYMFRMVNDKLMP